MSAPTPTQTAQGLKVGGSLRDLLGDKQADLIEQFVEASAVPMLVLNASDKVLHGNRLASVLFGVPIPELAESPLPSFLLRRICDGVLVPIPFPGVPGGGRSPEGAGQAVRSDGTTIEVNVLSAVIAVEGTCMTLVSLTDLSSFTRLEAEISSQHRTLAHLSRTASLSALSGSLAHELNQPLSAILSNAQAGARYLSHEPANIPEVSISFDKVIESAKRAGDVIRKMRRMLRNEVTEFTRVDMNVIVRDVLQLLRSDLIDRGITLSLDLTEALPTISGDPVQLQQVLLNLIINAAESMRVCDRDRALLIATDIGSNETVDVRVADVGHGIATEDLSGVFTPFYTTNDSGLGIGLSVCMMIVQAHRGRLWATNDQAFGCTFHVSFPSGSPK